MRNLHMLVCAAPAAAVIGVAACASQPGVPRTAAHPPGATLVEVRNHGYSDQIVYLIRSGTRFRLGFVRGNETQTFKLPSHADLTGPLQLVARPVAGDPYLVPAVSVLPGQRVELTLTSVSRLSSIAVWNR